MTGPLSRHPLARTFCLAATTIFVGGFLFDGSLLGALGAQQQPRPLPHPLDTTPEFERAVRNGTRTADGRPGAKAWRDRQSYVIDAELVPERHRVEGTVTMTYENGSPEPLEDLVIHLRQNLHAPTARRNIEVEVTGGMSINRVQLDGRAAPHWVDGTVMTIQLREPVPKGGRATVTMTFAFNVPAGEAPRMGRDGAEVYFLGYWYPQFAVRDDVNGWVAEQYLGGSEFYMGYGDYEVALTAPAGYLVQATGTLQNTDAVLTEKARAALQRATKTARRVTIVSATDVAAGQATLPGKGGRLTWKFRAQNVRDFAVSAANGYVWDAIRTEVGDRDGDGQPDHCLSQALYRPTATTWRRGAKYARHAIEWLSENVMPYPWPHATVVEGILGGGMEYPMITLCGDQENGVALQSLVAHELAHMWFPMIVGSNEKAHVWQDEGIVDFYTELIDAAYWRRKTAGRRTTAIYRDIANAGQDREPLLTHADHLVDQDNYYLNGYIKPAALLHQLAGLFGRDAVLRALRSYAEDWRYAHPYPIDFFRSMNAALGADLDWYWSSWWSETWTLDHAIATVRDVDGGTEVVVADRGRAICPATVRVTYGDGSTASQTVPAATWLTGAREATLRFGPDVVRAIVDPDHCTLDLDDGNDQWQRSKKKADPPKKK
ncbi:MAG: M1 family metallopeptidase [bacterium]|nr:M1 family metallopeptidase [bacterium]